MKIVKYGAEWCLPCKYIQPILKELESENPNVVFEYKDVDQEPDATEAIQLKIKSIPTVIIYIEDKERQRIVGSITKKKLQDVINELSTN